MGRVDKSCASTKKSRWGTRPGREGKGSDLTSLFINQAVLVEQRAAIWNDTSVLLCVMEGQRRLGSERRKVCLMDDTKTDFLYFVELSAVDFNFT